MGELNTATGKRQISDETPGLIAKRLPFKSIPIIDIGGAYSSRLGDRRAVASQIRSASIGVGFFYIKNHGVAQPLIDRTFGASRDFFGLPLAEKMKLHVSMHKHHAGYIPLQGEKLNEQNSDRGDLKESLEFTVGVPEQDLKTMAEDPFIGDAILPESHAELRQVLKEYYDAMWELMNVLNRLSALALDLPEDFFAGAFRNPITNIRLLRYPPMPADAGRSEKIRGCGEHSDYLGYTLLAQDAIGGLEVLNCAGEWIEALPVPGTFVVNTGDLISHWTNGLFASTVHRVALKHNDHFRHAIAFFTGPNFDSLIECLPSCTDAATPAKYPPVKTGEYLYSRLNSTVQYQY